MSRKHHVKKNRSRSNYKQRLADRGLSKAPTMKTVEQLRKKLGKEDQQIITDRERAAMTGGRKGGRSAR